MASELTVELQVPSAPKPIVPGQELRIPITVRDHTGWGVAGQRITLGTSAGEFANLTDLGKGNYQAVYRMPASRHPQAVILAAKLPGRMPVWKVLVLQSKTVLPVNTSKPNVMVTLSVGGRQYGPHRTDAEGRVKIPVNVRPGESEARAVAVDEFGNRTTRRVTIPVPPSSRLLGLAEKSILVADGNDRTDIFLIVINPNGTPHRRANFVAYKKTGKVARAMRMLPGLYRLRYTAPARLDPPRAKLTLALKEAPRLSRHSFVFALSAGNPSELTLAAEPESLFADGSGLSTLRMEVRDDAGHLVPGAVPRLTCSGGKLGPVAEEDSGRFRAGLTAPDQPIGEVKCTASLRPAGKKPLEAVALVKITELIPAAIKAECQTNELLADGISRARVDVTVTDQRGDPLDEQALRSQAATGALGEIIADSQGRYHFSYTAPSTMQAGRVRISVEAGSGDSLVTDHVVIELVAPPPPPRPTPWLSLGPWVGLSTNFGRLTYAAFSLEGLLRLPFAKKHLYLALEGGYRFGQQTGESGIRDVSLQTRVEYAPVHLSLVYKLSSQADFTPYAGIGGGAEFVQWTLSTSDGATERGHQVLPAGLAWLGAELRVGSGAFFVQARYLYAYLSDRSAVEQNYGSGGSRIKGNIGGLEVGGGYRLSL